MKDRRRGLNTCWFRSGGGGVEVLVGSISSQSKKRSDNDCSDSHTDNESSIGKGRALGDNHSGFLLPVREVVVTRVHVVLGASLLENKESAIEVGSCIIELRHFTPKLEGIGESGMPTECLSKLTSIRVDFVIG